MFNALLLLGDDSVAVAVGFLGGQVENSEDAQGHGHEVEQHEDRNSQCQGYEEEWPPEHDSV
ncbi:hypothetical protein AS038_10065 [Arthrobacter sp. NIO-1057]|nr:hypothetical protein AS038_10065 [Arthrobacter sp. NIO-1057]